MTNVIGQARARLADVQCSRFEFRPGDRIVVRTFRQMDPEQVKKLKKTVERWAGNQVEVLVINALEMAIHVEPAQIIS